MTFAASAAVFFVLIALAIAFDPTSFYSTDNLPTVSDQVKAAAENVTNVLNRFRNLNHNTLQLNDQAIRINWPDLLQKVRVAGLDGNADDIGSWTRQFWTDRHDEILASSDENGAYALTAVAESTAAFAAALPTEVQNNQQIKNQVDAINERTDASATTAVGLGIAKFLADNNDLIGAVAETYGVYQAEAEAAPEKKDQLASNFLAVWEVANAVCAENINRYFEDVILNNGHLIDTTVTHLNYAKYLKL